MNNAFLFIGTMSIIMTVAAVDKSCHCRLARYGTVSAELCEEWYQVGGRERASRYRVGALKWGDGIGGVYFHWSIRGTEGKSTRLTQSSIPRLGATFFTHQSWSTFFFRSPNSAYICFFNLLIFFTFCNSTITINYTRFDKSISFCSSFFFLCHTLF